MIDTAVILRRFEEPDEVRQFQKGKFEIVNIGGMTVDRATYEPLLQWRVESFITLQQVHSSTFRLSLTVAGSWAMSLMCPCTF